MLIWREKVREVYNKVPEVESRKLNVECGVKNPKSKIKNLEHRKC